jgi:hypothetical protein
MSNKGLLTIIAVLLLGILTLMFVDFGHRDQSLGSSIGEAVEEVGDEIDDNTDAM